MDSREQNDLKARRREEALARRIGEALDRLSPRAQEECPDASLLAAYHERALDAQELEQWEGHFAACGRCRRILTVLAAGSDAPLTTEEVERFGNLAQAAREHAASLAQPQATEIKPQRPRLADWRWRWLAPALGAAAAAALWFAVWPAWRAKHSASENVLIAQQTQGAPQPAPTPPPSLPPAARAAENTPTSTAKNAADINVSSAKKLDEAARRKARPARSPSAGADKLAAAPPPAPPPANPALGSMEKSAPQSRDAAEALKAPSAPAPRGVAGGVAGTENALAARQAQAQAQAAPAPSPELQKEESRTASALSTTAAPPAMPQPVAEAPVQEFAANQKASGSSASQSVEVLTTALAARKPLVVLTGPGEVRWRAGALGWIARSTDGGRTWKAQTSPGQEMWLAGAAPAENVCWLVGMNGAIARTTDGEHWEKIPPPTAAADANGKFPEWLEIIASDASHATITARDRRSFSTSDGGKTWSLRQ